MKPILSLIIGVLINHQIIAQGGWIEKQNFGGSYRSSCVSFVIGNKAYVALGGASTTSFNDLWEWNESTGTWSQKASLPAPGRIGAIGFAIGYKGYVGLGLSTNPVVFYRDFWEWSQATNTWIQKQDFPGSPRQGSFGAAIESKGYLIGGFDGNFKSDFWQWDKSSGQWLQIGSMPGSSGRYRPTGFVIDGNLYVGTGLNSNDTLNDFWQWQPGINLWSQKSSLPAKKRFLATGFSIANKGYLGLGFGNANTTNDYLNDFWQWDKEIDLWQRVSDFPDARCGAIGFALNSKGYIGTGADNFTRKDFWQFNPTAACNSVSIIAGPSNSNSSINSNATFTVLVAGTPPYIYNWQVSTDGGNIWTNLSNSGNTTWTSSGYVSSLTVSNTQMTMDGYQYRCNINNCNSVNPTQSNGAILSIGSANFLSGQVFNPTLSDLTGAIQLPLQSCTVKVFQLNSSNLVASFNSPDGNFHFSGLPTGFYDVVASFNDGINLFEVTQQNVSENASNLRLNLTENLCQRIEEYNTQLENSNCFLEDLGYTIPLRPYQVTSSRSFINQRHIIQNTSNTIEALERLCIAERALVKYLNQASEVNNEYVQSVGELAQFAISLIKVGECSSFMRELTNELLDLLKSSITYPNTPYRNFYKIAVDITFDYLKQNISTTTVYGLVRDPVDRLLTNENLNNVHIQSTQVLLNNAVYNSSHGLFSGQIQNTIASVNSSITQSSVKTAESNAIARSYRDRPEWVSTLTHYTNLFNSLTCGLFAYTQLLEWGLNGVHLGFLASSIYQSVNRESELIMENSNVGQNSYSRLFPSINNNTPNVQSLTGIVNEFEVAYGNTISAMNSGSMALLQSNLQALVQINSKLNDSITNSINKYKSYFASGALNDSTYLNGLKTTLFGSPIARYSAIAALSYYIQNPLPDLRDSINSFSNGVLSSDISLLNELDQMNLLLENDFAPSNIICFKSTVPLFTDIGQVLPIKVKFKNYGSEPASDVYIKIKIDAPFSSSIDSIYVGQVGINEVDSISFSISSPLIFDTSSRYYIEIFSNEGLNTPLAGMIKTITGSVVAMDRIKLSGISHGNYNRLSWNLNPQQQKDTLLLQRSSDENIWESIFTKVDYHSQVDQSFSYSDNKTFGKNYYYRIISKDVSGYALNSNIVFLASKNSELISIYPNPTNGKNSIIISEPRLRSVTAKAFLTDLSGKQIKKIDVYFDEFGKATVNLNEIAPSIYFLTIIAPNYCEKAKIVHF